MEYIQRSITPLLVSSLRRGKSILLLGPRQVGKSTLLKTIPSDLTISFLDAEKRLRFERAPSLLSSEIGSFKKVHRKKKPVVILDEVQKVPLIMDVVQKIIDDQEAIFILTGSSARKLKRNPEANFLPGRVVSLRLDPLSLIEIKNPLILEDLLSFGSLPGIFQVPKKNLKEIDLESYVTTYLEEEVRSESLVRNMAPFSRFLELAAAEAGNPINAWRISQDIGISHTTIQGYYQILEDCLIVERIEPFTTSKTRKKLIKANKYLFFDMGVRRVAAREGTSPPAEHRGHLFEQFVGLELIRHSRLDHPRSRIRFWRDADGPEVDWIIEKSNKLIPIETKWTDLPRENDARHLSIFLKEYPQAKNGYIICRTPRRFSISKNITAIPWQEIPSLF